MGKKMNLIAQASGGNGIWGDQTGRELNFSAYGPGYSSGGFGHVFRFKPEYAAYAEKAAMLQEWMVNNGHIGYKNRNGNLSLTPPDTGRRGALFAMVAAQAGKDFEEWAGQHFAANKVAWKDIDVTKLHPWDVEDEVCADCSSLTCMSFMIATGMWFHNQKCLERTTVGFADTRPNTSARLSASSNSFYGKFCTGEWTPIMNVPGLWSKAYPCYSEETDTGTVGQYFSGVTGDLANRPCTLHRITFKLGSNNSTYTPVRNSYLSGSSPQYDSLGNRICADLYQYRWFPIMDHYIADSDGETLLKEQYNDDGEPYYVTASGAARYQAVDRCAVWDRNPTVNGWNSTTINCPPKRDLEGEDYATVLEADTTFRYVLMDGYSNGTYDLTDACKLGHFSNYSFLTMDYDNGKFQKRTVRHLYDLSGNTLRKKTLTSGGNSITILYPCDSNGDLVSGASSVYVLTGGTPNTASIILPMYAFTTGTVVTDGDAVKINYGSVLYPFTKSTTDFTVDIISTGTFYRHWRFYNADGTVKEEYIQTWAAPSASSDVDEENSTETGEDTPDAAPGDATVKYLANWYKVVSGVLTQIDYSPIDTDVSGESETVEEEAGDNVIITSHMNVIKSSKNLERGDIVSTRKWTEGNTSGGHVVMFV